MSINLVENYAVNQARQAVKDSLQAHGEQCILLSMYHRFTDSDMPLCPYCTDDVYTDSGEVCNICWGTTIQGGVRQAAKVWGLFTDNVEGEQYRKRGIWQADNREFQTEAFPILMQHDYVIRVRRWNANGTPAELEGFYGIKEVTKDSLRTGTRFGQSASDIIGQKAQISELSNVTNIAKYPVIGIPFLSPEAFIAPHTPMITRTNPFPFAPAPDVRHAVVIGNGQSHSITIPHELGTSDVIVQLYNLATGEQVDANVFAATMSTVTLVFDTAPSLNSLRAVITAFGTRHAFTIGDGDATTIVVQHNLGTTNILTQLYDSATGEQVDTNIYATDSNSVTLTFQDPPATDSLRVVIVA
jgi:hypothetical protein